MKSYPNFYFENELWNKNTLACGIDEVGRGCFAGPLVSAGVILKPVKDLSLQKYILSFGINDSKLVSIKKRKMLKEVTQEFILFSTIKYISVDIINEKNIGSANKLAFNMVAQETLDFARDQNIVFLTDAFKITSVPQELQKNIIRGDKTSISIALASILAKVERDTFMENLSIEFPGYGFEKHKGYGTKLHRELLKTKGASIHHRTEFVKHYI